MIPYPPFVSNCQLTETLWLETTSANMDEVLAWARANNFRIVRSGPGENSGDESSVCFVVSRQVGGQIKRD